MNIRTLEPEKAVNEALKNSSRLTGDLRALLVYRKIVTGQGLEFDRLREYSPGDEARMIDWNSLARTNRLYTKVFEEERLLNTIIIQDVSSSMATGTTEVLKNEYASIVSTTLARTALDAGDKAGFKAFSSELKGEIPPTYGEEIPFEIAQKLSEKSIYGGVTDWEQMSENLIRSHGSESFLFIISDFQPFNEDLEKFLTQADNFFRGVFCIMVKDPLDSKMPEGVGKAYMTDPETGEKVLVDVDKVREEYTERAAEKEKKVRDVVEASGGHFFKTLTSEDFLDGFAHFLDRRREMWS